MSFIYYLTKTKSGLIELRQTRFKESFCAGVARQYDVCGIARSKSEMHSMLESCKIDVNTVDWGS